MVFGTMINIPVVPARGRAEVALDFIIRPFSTIEPACAVRLPGPCVRACFVRTCCAVAVQEHGLRATTLQCTIKQTVSSHFTPPSHSALHASHLHFTLHTSSHLKSSDFFSPHVTSSQLFSSIPIPSHMSSQQDCFHLIRALRKLISTHFSSSASQKALTVRKKVFCAKKIVHRELLHTEALRHRSICTKKTY